MRGTILDSTSCLREGKATTAMVTPRSASTSTVSPLRSRSVPASARVAREASATRTSATFISTAWGEEASSGNSGSP